MTPPTPFTSIKMPRTCMHTSVAIKHLIPIYNYQNPNFVLYKNHHLPLKPIKFHQLSLLSFTHSLFMQSKMTQTLLQELTTLIMLTLLSTLPKTTSQPQLCSYPCIPPPLPPSTDCPPPPFQRPPPPPPSYFPPPLPWPPEFEPPSPGTIWSAPPPPNPIWPYFPWYYMYPPPPAGDFSGAVIVQKQSTLMLFFINLLLLLLSFF